MPSIFDEFPYPWHRRDAQQLHSTVVKLHPTARAALQHAEEVNVDTSMLDPQQPPFFVWRQVFVSATNEGSLRQIIQNIHDRLGHNSPVRPILADALAGKSIPDPEPTSAGGAAQLIAGSSYISKDEALLYRDDLTLQMGKLPGLIKVLERMLQLSPAVCKLVVEINGYEQYGTAFRIGKDVLLTNWHVVHKLPEEELATVVNAEFGYEDDGGGGFVQSRAISCNVASIVSNKNDDWAVINTVTAMDDAWPIIKLSEADEPELNAPAYIIQHPLGSRKRLGFVRNQVSFFDQQVVQYLTDTQEGSSGAPVFNAAGVLIALHHCGGEPQEKIGKPPMKKNEGIRISRIVEGLNAKNIAFA